MNKKFFELPLEKQQRILNATMEVFSKNDYKRAITDDIAALAGISKGLLFYYFHNKKALYFYVFEYSTEIIMKEVCNDDYKKIDDFFELMLHSMYVKIKLMKENPYIYDFIFKVYFETDENVIDSISKLKQESIATTYATYFSGIDKSKFKEGIDPNQILRMLTYMADGYMREQQRIGVRDLDVIKSEYISWMQLLKASVYKEEYLV
jgi:AcrR family transcriptional regulator